MTEVAVIVGSHSANIHLDGVAQRLELFFLSGKSVVDFHSFFPLFVRLLVQSPVFPDYPFFHLQGQAVS